MKNLERPRIRPGLAAGRDGDAPGRLLVWDQLRISSEPVSLTLLEFELLQRMNGRYSLAELQAAAVELGGGAMVEQNAVLEFVQRLDQGLYLDSPRFEGHLNAPVREPSCIGCYPAEATEIRPMLESLFTMPGGPGLPGEPSGENRLKAALLPHIDYARGNVSYAWGFKELFEQTDASLFVIIATSHYSPARFTLTRKHFRTPLGIAPTDQEYVDRLVSHYGDGLFDDPYAHYPEHSVELEVLLLQYLYEGVRPIRIVPLVVGSFRDCVESGEAPREQQDIARMISALRRCEAESSENICYVISGDLAHIGPKFDDPQPVSSGQLEQSRLRDLRLMQHAAAVNPAAYFQEIADEGDSRRICGLPPTYTLLEAIRPTTGRLLHYGQYVHPQGFESVSFASVGFYS